MIDGSNFQNKDIVYLCKNNDKIRSVMATTDCDKKVISTVEKYIKLTQEQKKYVLKFFRRND